MAPVQPPHPPSSLSEADVQAFADGLLPPDRAAEVERYLRGRPDEARRVAFYDRLNGMMQSSFEHGPAGEGDGGHASMPPRLRRRAALMAVLHRWLRPVLAGLAVLVIVAGATVLAVRVPARSIDAAALAALMDVTQGGAAGGASPGTVGGAGAGAPDLSVAGMHVESRFEPRVGLLRHADGFVYRNQYGQPVVLLRVDDPTSVSSPQWRALRTGDNRLLMWTNDHTRYVLAGRANTHGLMQAADLMTLGSSLMSRPSSASPAASAASASAGHAASGSAP